MAGWASWADIQIATSTSVGKTVLESIWPEVRRVAAAAGWENWVDRLMVTLTEVIIRIKRSESPLFDRDDELQAAVRAGEIFANSNWHPGILKYNTADDAIAWVMNYVRTHPPLRALPEALNGVVRNNANLAALLPEGNDNARPGWNNQMTFDTYVEWLYVTNPDLQTQTEIGNALVAYVCGMCKLGEMTPAWIQSRIRQIRREAQNPELELVKRVCVHVWDFYGVAYRPENERFGAFFEFLQRECASKGLPRMYVNAMQAAEQGCTVLNLIAEAQRQCDDFNWNRFYDPRTPAERQIGQELRIWSADYEAMKADPWIRFTGASGRSPNMANLGYLAKQLLTRAMGQMSVQNYAGLDVGNLTIRHRAWIDRLVQQYIDHINRPIEAANEHPVNLAPGIQAMVHPMLNQPIRRARPVVVDIQVPRYGAQVAAAAVPQQAQAAANPLLQIQDLLERMMVNQLQMPAAPAVQNLQRQAPIYQNQPLPALNPLPVPQPQQFQQQPPILQQQQQVLQQQQQQLAHQLQQQLQQPLLPLPPQQPPPNQVQQNLQNVVQGVVPPAQMGGLQQDAANPLPQAAGGAPQGGPGQVVNPNDRAEEENDLI